MMDEQFFLYWEDIEWCHRMHDHGWQVLVEPAASVVHYRGVSAAPVGFVAQAYRDSLDHYCDLYGLWGLQAAVDLLRVRCDARRGAIADGRTASRPARLPHGDVDRRRPLHHRARPRARRIEATSSSSRSRPPAKRLRSPPARIRATPDLLVPSRSRRRSTRSRSAARASSPASRARWARRHPLPALPDADAARRIHSWSPCTT